jgi:hypothetical protein
VKNSKLEKEQWVNKFRIKIIERLLFTNAEPGILGLNFESKQAIKIVGKKQIAGGKSASVLLNSQKKAKIEFLKADSHQGGTKERSAILKTSISKLWNLQCPLPPALKPIAQFINENPPILYFTPTQEVIQILIRKAWNYQSLLEIEEQLEQATKSVNSEFDSFE